MEKSEKERLLLKEAEGLLYRAKQGDKSAIISGTSGRTFEMHPVFCVL